jgi:hypothetical protein
MSDYDIHSCGYYCDRPACIEAQRNELRDKLFSEPSLKGDDFERAFYRDWEAGKVKRVFESEPMIDGWPLYSGLPPIKVQDKTFEEFAQSFAQSARVNGIPERAQKCKWVGLSNEEKRDIYQEAANEDWTDLDVINATEARLKEKNCG